MAETKKDTSKESQSENSWTWKEISEHSDRESCWIYVNRDVYDVTKWLPKHPGGEEWILLFAGRDCTESFRAYHPFSDNPYAILEKFKIGTLKGPTEFVRWKEDTGFHKTVRERCAEWFKKNNLDPAKREPWYEFWRLFTSVGICQLYPLIVFKILPYFNVPFYLRWLCIFPMGLSGLMIALNVGHTSSHIPFLHNVRLNSFLGWLSWDVGLGLSWENWLHEHCVGHHQYTNIITIDTNTPESFDEKALFRSSPHQSWYKQFAYQFLWVPIFTAFLVWEIRLSMFQYWLKGYRKEIRISKEFLKPYRFLVFLLGKIIWFTRQYYIPLVIWKVPVMECLFIMIAYELVAGAFIGITLPANHVTNKVDWPTIRKDEKTGEARIDQEWAVMQIRTTKDYLNESWIFTNIVGALNNHSCHHLFPSMHHTYYQKIYPIVRQTAKEFNVPVNYVDSYFTLISDFVENLYNLSKEPKKSL